MISFELPERVSCFACWFTFTVPGAQGPVDNKLAKGAEINWRSSCDGRDLLCLPTSTSTPKQNIRGGRGKRMR